MKNQALKLVKTGLLVSCLFWSQTSFAVFIFSDVSYTTNSVSFNIDGDMTGYSEPDQNKNAFSIRYLGDIWSGPDAISLNSWSQPVFNDLVFQSQGLTGGFGLAENYSSSSYDVSSLSSATATNREIILTLGQDNLNETATSGMVQFLWGNGQERFDPTVLGYWDVSAPGVPEPPINVAEHSIIALFTAGLFGVGFARRRLA